MSNIYKTLCDRCGKEIIRPRSGVFSKVIMSVPKLRCIFIFGKGGDGLEYQYDLCYECTEDLKRFMKESRCTESCCDTCSYKQNEPGYEPCKSCVLRGSNYRSENNG